MEKKKENKVTFKSLNSPKISFRVGAGKHRFDKGYFVTDNEEIIKYLKKAYFCEVVK